MLTRVKLMDGGISSHNELFKKKPQKKQLRQGRKLKVTTETRLDLDAALSLEVENF